VSRVIAPGLHSVGSLPLCQGHDPFGGPGEDLLVPLEGLGTGEGSGELNGGLLGDQRGGDPAGVTGLPSGRVGAPYGFVARFSHQLASRRPPWLRPL
jgi:hypothetical protein